MLTERLDGFGCLVAEPARVAAIDPIERQIVNIAQSMCVRDADKALATLILIVGAGVDRRAFGEVLLLQAIDAPRQGQAFAYPFRLPPFSIQQISHGAPLIPRRRERRYFHMCLGTRVDLTYRM